jgi:hypothetical protein
MPDAMFILAAAVALVALLATSRPKGVRQPERPRWHVRPPR